MFRWSKSKDRVRERVFAVLTITLLSTTTACGNIGDANPISGAPAGNTDARLQLAIGQVNTLAEELMARTGIPGMAIAVVSGGQTVYAKGFGARQVGATSAVDPDTVFALASMSKSLGSTVVARQVELGRVQWETPIQQLFPWFTLYSLCSLCPSPKSDRGGNTSFAHPRRHRPHFALRPPGLPDGPVHVSHRPARRRNVGACDRSGRP